MRTPLPGEVVQGPNGRELELQEGLGEGAFGVVFLAAAVDDGEKFAVKFPRAAIFGGGEEVVAFLNEIMAAETVQHANVVKVVHVEAQDSDEEFAPYLVMEYVAGGTLSDELSRWRDAEEFIDIPVIKRWTRELVDGLAAINSKMLHRDLKPDNILMDRDTLKIGDFGLSKLVGAATRSRTFKGGQHVFYMAPEGWRLEANEPQIDMYSLGIVLFEMMGLEYPYALPSDTRDFDAIRDMHFFELPKSLLEIRSDIPMGVWHVVKRLLAKRPEERFKSWEDVKSALDSSWGASEKDGTKAGTGLFGSILETVERQYESVEMERARRERLRREQEEKRKLDEFSLSQLFGELREAVEKFNETSALGKINEIRPAGARPERVELVLPFGGNVGLRGFAVEPPLELRRGKVRYAVAGEELQASAGERVRMNFLLVREKQSDLYGEWWACRATNDPLLRPDRRMRVVEPFGFDPADIRLIEEADSGLHIVQLKYSSDRVGTFFEVLNEIMRRGA